METSLNPIASASRSRSRGLVLAGGILFVIGFGGPSLLLTAGLVRVTAACSSQA